MTLPITLDELNATDPARFVAALCDIFEHAPWVAAAAGAARPFATVAALHDAMMAALRARPRAEQIAFVAAHPDLAGKAARAGEVTPASWTEQAGLGLDRLSEDEFARFETLNAAYRRRFGFPFVICVRRQTRDAILAAFARRLANDTEAELATALAEIGHITRLRLVERVTGPGAPAVAGSLALRVLDCYHGRPAAGLGVELHELGAVARAKLAAAVADGEGRTELLAGQPLRIGSYELVLDLAGYFAAAGAPAPFFPGVALRFAIAEPEGRCALAVTISPFAYALTRGG